MTRETDPQTTTESPASRLLHSPETTAIYKGHAALRRGRASAPGASYFLTFCTASRASGLTKPELPSLVLGELQHMEDDRVWTVRCAVVMTDHVHLLVELGGKLSLEKAVSRLKAKTSADLRAAGVAWERGFFDHRLRTADDVLGIFLYIFLNPYRAGLTQRTRRWPWFFCRDSDWEWFKSYLDDDRPPPEWLAV